jgi:uncharacterized membrane protein
MEFLIELWLPILVGTVVLFFGSFLAWAVLPHHRADNKKVPHEDELMEFIRSKNIPAGNYLFPHAATGKEQGSKEYVELYTKGPRGILDVYDMPNMPINMAKTILFYFLTVLTIGYITFVACPPGAETTDWMKVFRIAGTIGVLTYASTGICNKIWFKRAIFTEFLDGIVFGVLVGLIYASLWPSGVVT